MRRLLSLIARPRRTRRAALLLVILIPALLAWLVAPLGGAFAAAIEPPLSAGASCAELARVDRTATNGPNWGVTLLPGRGAPGGWFGVPVCANSYNHVAPGGANVSCDRVPRNLWATGCAPGSPTSDGYGWSFQCVELVVRFSAWAFGAPRSGWHGDAPFLWLSSNHPSSFTQRLDGGAQPPVPGDILVWGTLDRYGRPWPAGPAGGHVAVVAATGDGWITFVEQNMLTARGNIPEETTSLTERGGRWTIGHTYALSGGRALYGWLHEKANSGHPSGSGVAPTASTRAAAPTPEPSLAQGVVVTGAGSLAQLVWSDSHLPTTVARASATGANGPHAVAESLGAPPGTPLAADQRPAVIALPGAARYVFALGRDGELYAAYTSGVASPSQGPLWQSLGAPAGVNLGGSVTAIWDGATLTVAATGSDGSLWARSGPAGMPDGWVSFGRPVSAATGAQVSLASSPALLRLPGAPAAAHTTDAAWMALAIGADGALYELDSPSRSTTPPGASGATGAAIWSQVTIAGLNAPLTGAALAFAEPGKASTRGRPGEASAVGSVDALMTDSAGRLWLLRRAALSATWQARSVALPDPDATLLAVSPTGGVGGLALNVYVTDPQVSASRPENQVTGQTAAALPVAGLLTRAIPLDGSTASNWTVMGYAANSGGSGQIAGSGQPVALAVGAPALLLATATQVNLAGGQSSLGLLAPGVRATPAPPALDAGQEGTSTIPASPPLVTGAGSLLVGTIAAPNSFSDQFTGGALDPRWAVMDAQAASAVVVSDGLTLTAPTSGGDLEAVQGAPSGDYSLTAKLTPGAQWPAGGQAGLRLALDDWNSLTLMVNSAGTARLCPVVAGAALACQTTALTTALTTGHSIYVRVATIGVTVAAAVSRDGVSWSPAGLWSVAWAPSAQAAPRGAYAPPFAGEAAAGEAQNPYAATPALFTRVGVVVAGAASVQFGWIAVSAGGAAGATR